MTAPAFTKTARLKLRVAGDEAAALRHEYIGTEHILLALLADSDCRAAQLIARSGADTTSISATIVATVKPGVATLTPTEPRPFTSRAKKALELAMIAARDDDHSPVSTQHLLLGLVREETGIAAQMLTHAGVTAAGLTSALGEDAAHHEF